MVRTVQKMLKVKRDGKPRRRETDASERSGAFLQRAQQTAASDPPSGLGSVWTRCRICSETLKEENEGEPKD